MEILTSISGVTFEERHAVRAIAELDDVRANLIGLEHLRKNKRPAAATKIILNDLDNLR